MAKDKYTTKEFQANAILPAADLNTIVDAAQVEYEKRSRHLHAAGVVGNALAASIDNIDKNVNLSAGGANDALYFQGLRFISDGSVNFSGAPAGTYKVYIDNTGAFGKTTGSLTMNQFHLCNVDWDGTDLSNLVDKRKFLGKAVLVGKDAEKPSSAAEGDLFFSSDTDKLYAWTGSQWKDLQAQLAAHASTHERGGNDIVKASRILYGLEANRPTTTLNAGDAYWATDTGKLYIYDGAAWILVGPVPPAAHKATHEDGGSDEVSVANLSGILADFQKAFRLRTGLDASKPSSGNTEGDIWWATDTNKLYIWDGTAWLLVGPAAPSYHKETHQDGGADEISVAGLSGRLADYQTTDRCRSGLNANKPGSGNTEGDMWYSTDTDELYIWTGGAWQKIGPAAAGTHAATHEDGGADEISVANLSGLLADFQKALRLRSGLNADKPGSGNTTGDVWYSTDTKQFFIWDGTIWRLMGPAAVEAHASSHQDGGADEISVANLSGELADVQKPKAHDHTATDNSGILTNDEHDGFSEYLEIAAPSTPAANKVRLYAKDKAGVSHLYFKKDDGTEVEIGTGGGGADTRVATKIVAADGSGDYTDIQSGIDGLPTAGGVLYIKNGTYSISATINVNKANVALIGSGANCIVEIGAAAASYPGFTISKSDILIQNIKFKGAAGAQAGYSGIYIYEATTQPQRVRIVNCDFYKSTSPTFYGVKIENANEIMIERCHFNSCTYGVYTLSSVSKCIFSNNMFIDCLRAWYASANPLSCQFVGNFAAAASGEYGLYIVGGGATSYLVIANNYIRSPSHAIYLSNVLAVLVTGNILYPPGGRGVAVYDGSKKINITGNYFTSGAGGVHINAVGDSFCVVSDNRIEGCSYEAVKIERSSRNVIEGNQIYNACQAANDLYSAIFLTDDGSTFSLRNVVSSNVLHFFDTNLPKYGIRENATGDDYNLIHGNIVTGAVTTQISKQGANSVEADNITG